MAFMNVSLIEMSDAFDKLCACIKRQGSWQKLNFDTFYDMDLSRNEALVIAWLHIHKNITFSCRDISESLGIKEAEVEQALFSLIAHNFIKRTESDDIFDVVDLDWIKFSILDKQACIASGIMPKPIKRDRPKKDNRPSLEELENPDGEDYWKLEQAREEEELNSHIIPGATFIPADRLVDDEALEKMENFDIDGDDEAFPEFEEEDDY